MRALVIACVAVLFTFAVPAARQESPVKYFPASEMAAIFVKGGTVTAGANYTVMAAQRTGTGEAELHADDTDVFRIMSGSATFVTGGRLVGARTTAPGETRGTAGDDIRLQRCGIVADVAVIQRGAQTCRVESGEREAERRQSRSQEQRPR